MRVEDDAARLVAHSPEHRARHGYAFAFDGPAEPRRFLAMLRGCFRDDADAEQKSAFIQEFGGACLFGHAPRYSKALIFWGESAANGKSQIQECLAAAMPRGSVSVLAPQDWRRETVRAELSGILLNTVSELPEQDILDAESIKAVITGEEVSARKLYGRPYQIRPLAGHVFAANRLPLVSDPTDGFWRRWEVLTFNRSFKGDPSAVPNLGRTIAAAEAPEIVRWLVAGAARAVARGGYAAPSSSSEALATWRGEASPTTAFLAACTRPATDREPGTAAALLYASYRVWCETNGHRAASSTRFGRALSALRVPWTKPGPVKVYRLMLVFGIG